MRPQPRAGGAQDRFASENGSRRQRVWSDDSYDGYDAPPSRRSPYRRRQVAAVLAVFGLVLLVIYGANVVEWVSAVLSPHQGPCTPVNVTFAEIMGPSYPAQSLNDSHYWTGPQAGGIPHKRALAPPCTITNAKGKVVPTFVQVNGVYLRNYSPALYDCSDHFKYVNGGGPYPNNQVFCDNVGDIFTIGATTGEIHIEFDQDWQAKGLCGPGIPSCDTAKIFDYRSDGTISLDLRGYVFWDEEHWELHPATSWKLSSTPTWP